VIGVKVRRKGASAAKIMSRMQAMIKGFRKMLGITDAELKKARNKSLRRK